MDKSRNVVLALLLLAAATPAAAQITLHTSTEQIRLKAYAEFHRNGMLVLSSGSLKDIPTITDFRSIRVSLTGWVPGKAMVASMKLFEDEKAERRLVTIATKRIGVTAYEVRIADLEDPARIAELLRGVGEETGAAAYFFFGLVGDGGDGMIRYYPFKMLVKR
jgi:hypothetical protein